ncbi:MAG: hypothetical protein QOJ64_1480 [Acidobacteriota bacterium]|jgi:hypothetical protein|nr:hypothetical protein [Acidobacteriota bacterium]
MTLPKWLTRLIGARSKGSYKIDPYSTDPPTEAADPFNPFPEPIVLEISDVFDVHTVPPRDAKLVVEAYLAEARAAGFNGVRIIHGKGKGIQRQMVHSILARTPFVDAWSDAPPQAGGIGATIVRFSRRPK